MKKITIGTLLLVAAFVGHTQEEIIGHWTANEGETIVEVYQNNQGTYVGKIVWLAIPTNKSGEPCQDRKNPDKQLKDRPLIGIHILEGLKYNDGIWQGTLYSPKKGRTVDATLQMDGHNLLDIQVSFRGFSKKVVWTRNEVVE